MDLRCVLRVPYSYFRNEFYGNDGVNRDDKLTSFTSLTKLGGWRTGMFWRSQTLTQRRVTVLVRHIFFLGLHTPPGQACSPVRCLKAAATVFTVVVEKLE